MERVRNTASAPSREPLVRWLVLNFALVPVVIVAIELARWVASRGDFVSELVLILWWVWVPFGLATLPFLALLYFTPRRRVAAVALALVVVVAFWVVDAIAYHRLPWAEPDNLWLGAGYPILYSLVVRLSPRSR